MNWSWMKGRKTWAFQFTKLFSWPDAGGDRCQYPVGGFSICGVERRNHSNGVVIFADGREIKTHRFTEKEK
jgi:hypothetical protein